MNICVFPVCMQPTSPHTAAPTHSQPQPQPNHNHYYNHNPNLRKSATSRELNARGLYWSRHVLETPIAWIMVFTYVMATVIAGAPLVTGIARAAGLPIMIDNQGMTGLLVADGLIYVFSPQLCMLLLRLALA